MLSWVLTRHVSCDIKNHTTLQVTTTSIKTKRKRKSRRLIPNPLACCVWWECGTDWDLLYIMLNLKNPIICVYIFLELDSFIHSEHVITCTEPSFKKKTIKPNLNLWFVSAWECSLSMRIFVTQSEKTRVRISLPKETEI